VGLLEGVTDVVGVRVRVAWAKREDVAVTVAVGVRVAEGVMGGVGV
jgi:hypothetical protein